MFSKKKLEQIFDILWPINRSITGNGVRETLKVLSEYIRLNIYEEKSGTKVFDWIVPSEWNVKKAYIITPNKNKIADFSINNLHLLGYSTPIKKILTLEELRPHLYTLENQPSAIPYVTSYYKKTWGFCITHNEYVNLTPGDYEVVIDTEFKQNGSLTYADSIIKGSSNKEVLLSTYICHPSMANNELSGPLLSIFLYNILSQRNDLKYNYRFVFVPETIGAICYLNKFGKILKKNVYAGFVITCVGDKGEYTYKKTRDLNSITDRITIHILKFSGEKYKLVDFFPMGSDERQYSSPGFNLPIGSLMRSMYGTFEEYHTSLDNKNFISFSSIQETGLIYLKIIEAMELDGFYINTVLFCEPQLGVRDLYPQIGTKNEKNDLLKKILYILNYSDGKHSLLEIAEKINCSILDLKEPLNILLEKKLLKKYEYE